MKNIISISVLFAVLANGSLALANDNGDGKSHSEMEGVRATEVRVHKGQGVVNKIDLSAGKVNLTHGPIKSLGWPGMTMDFSAKDPAVLKNIKVGQKVHFDVVNEGPRKYFVTKITPEE